MKLDIRDKLDPVAYFGLEDIWSDDNSGDTVSLEEIKTLAEINGAKDFETEEEEHFVNVQEQEFEVLVNDVKDDELLMAQLESYHTKLIQVGVISKNDVPVLNNLGLESLPDVRTYTELPSATNYAVSMEKLVDAMKKVGSAIFKGIALIIRKCIEIVKRVYDAFFSKRAKVDRISKFSIKTAEKMVNVFNNPTYAEKQISELVPEKLEKANKLLTNYFKSVDQDVSSSLDKASRMSLQECATFIAKAAYKKNANALLQDKVKGGKWISVIRDVIFSGSDQSIANICDSFHKFLSKPDNFNGVSIIGYKNLGALSGLIPGVTSDINSADEVLDNWNAITSFIKQKLEDKNVDFYNSLSYTQLMNFDKYILWSKIKNDLHAKNVSNNLVTVAKVMAKNNFEMKFSDEQKQVLNNFKNSFTAMRKHLIAMKMFRDDDYALAVSVLRAGKVQVSLTKLLIT